MNPRIFITVYFCFIALMGTGCSQNENSSSPKPNIIILFMDDVGYGDLSSYGHPVIKTPHMDKLAGRGVRFTSFVTGSWCVPSRTQLLTGRYMPRVDFGGRTGSDGQGGLPESELTLAEGLKQAGYSTGMAGKWHLGYIKEQFLPPNQGFDSWFGLPYSNDYRKPWVQTDEPLGLYRGTKMVEHPINQDSLTVRYTQEAINFIQTQSKKDSPFFFYLAYNMAHLPIHTTHAFRGKSGAGLYGDVMQTLDWSVGEIMQSLNQLGITENTIVFLASDNGPWLNTPERMNQAGNKPWHQGTAGLLRGSKATTYEGGARVAAMLSWPDEVPSGQVTDALVAAPDIYRTLLETAGASLPEHPLDGYNIMPFLKGESPSSPRNEYVYFLNGRLEAMRVDEWKLRLTSDKPELFNLQIDPSERYNRASEKPQMVEQIQRKMEEIAAETGTELPERGD